MKHTRRWNDDMKLTGFLWPWLRSWITVMRLDPALRENLVFALFFILALSGMALAKAYPVEPVQPMSIQRVVRG